MIDRCLPLGDSRKFGGAKDLRRNVLLDQGLGACAMGHASAGWGTLGNAKPEQRPKRPLRGCIYSRYSTQWQDSTQAQIERCQQWAKDNNVEVEPRHIYSDEAQSGRSTRRAAFQQMLQALDAGEIDVVITFATNRLFRKIYRALQFVEEKIVEKRRRCVFVAQGIDTRNTGFWKALMMVFSMADEYQIDMTREHVRSSLASLAAERRVHNTLAWGYRGVSTGGQTKYGKPVADIHIDPAAQPWVRRIFDWFVEDELLYSEIGARLRAQGAPRPRKAPRWNSRVVKRLLTNRRYIGDWSYGRCENVWQSAADYSRQRRRERPLRELQFEELRIISDELFARAQERVKELAAGRSGRPKADAAGEHLPDPTRNLCWCAVHDIPLTGSGPGGRRLVCRLCARADQDDRVLYSGVRRQDLLRHLCIRLGGELDDADGLVPDIIAAAQADLAARPSADASEIQRLRKEEARSTEHIQFIMEAPGETAQDRRENQEQLKRVREQRSQIQKRLRELEKASAGANVLPDVATLKAELGSIRELLIRGANSNDPDQLRLLRDLLRQLTGGRIVMAQQGDRRKYRGWLSGSFRLRLPQTLLQRLGANPGEMAAREVVVEFRRSDPNVELSERVKELADQGLLMQDIAKRLNIGRSRPGRLLKLWYTSRGLPAPNLKRRMADLVRQTAPPPKHVQLAPRVGELLARNMKLADIAAKLGVNRNVVTAAARHWYQLTGQTPIDGRTRRRQIRLAKDGQGQA